MKVPVPATVDVKRLINRCDIMKYRSLDTDDRLAVRSHLRHKERMTNPGASAVAISEVFSPGLSSVAGRRCWKDV